MIDVLSIKRVLTVFGKMLPALTVVEIETCCMALNYLCKKVSRFREESAGAPYTNSAWLSSLIGFVVANEHRNISTTSSAM